MMKWCDYETIGEDENIRLAEERAGNADKDKYHNEERLNFVVFTDR
jgi:hypothetical protein